ncbi:MAG: carbohydrate-binding family 9-like protein [Cyclobacteriaceae bacterium]
MNNHFSSLILFFLSIPLVVSAQISPKGEVLMKHTPDFELTGDGTGGAWSQTTWIPLVKRKGMADYKTEVKLLYSDSGIYGLFSCKDKKITATLKEDFANLWTEDVIEIFFWPDESVPLYFEYELSPLNYELSILVPNLDGNFLGWKPWKYEGERKTRHATKILKDTKQNPTEWIGEFFIPYALLKPLRNVPPKKGSQWRMNMYRIDYDQEYTSWTWLPVQKNFHDFEKFGVMRFE